MTVLALFVAWGVAAGLAWRFCDPSSRWYIPDYPNERSLHHQPTSRSGGVAVLAGLCIGALVVSSVITNGPIVLWIGLLLVAGVSFLDDRKGVSPGWRMLMHVLAASFLLMGGYGTESVDLPAWTWMPPHILMIAILVLFIVWMINLYNFMDGMDGLAGGMAVIGFVSFAVLGKGDVLFVKACLLIAAAAAGFLWLNLPPARIFLGDTGSSSLGLLVAGFSLWANREGLFPLWLAILVFSPFIVDATVTLIRRLLRGEKIWQAHRTHYYQRLVRMGWGQKRTLAVEYMLMLACSLSALWAKDLPEWAQMAVLGFWLLAYVLFILALGALEKHRKVAS